jgi:hypothetical protein
MPLVKQVWVVLSEKGAEEVKAALDGVAARAEEISRMDPTIKLSVSDAGALQKIAALRLALKALHDQVNVDNTGALRNLITNIKAIGDGADAGRVKLSALRLELLAIEELGRKSAMFGGGGGVIPGERGGLFGTLLSGLTGGFFQGGAGGGGLASLGALFGGGGGIASVLGSVGGIASMIGIAMTGILGAIPGMLAGGLGLGAAGLFGYRDLGMLTRGIPRELRGLQRGFQPIMAPLAHTGNDILKGLLLDLVPLARAAAPAIEGLLKAFDGFVSSPGFKAFIEQMSKMAGPWITTIGKGLGEVALAVGKLILALANPDALRAAKYFFEFLALAITGAAKFITRFTEGTIVLFHDIAVAFDYVRRSLAIFAHDWAHEFDMARHWVATFAHDVAHYFDDVRHTVASWAHDIAHYFDDVRHFFATLAHDVAHFFDDIKASYSRDSRDVQNWVNDVIRVGQNVIRWFEQLPGRIRSALGSLASALFSIGQNAIMGLIHGIESMAGSLLSAAQHIASSIIGTLSSVLHIGSPSRVTYQHGRWLAEGLAMGMDDGRFGVEAAALRLGQSALFGGAHGVRAGPQGFGGVGSTYVTVNVPPTVNMADLGRQLAIALGEYKRRGGWIYKPAGF